LTLYLM